MLIKCPECGKEISDKSKACIHCGYPIYNVEYICTINGVDYDCEHILKTALNGEMMLSLKSFKDMTGCTLISAKYFVDEVILTQSIPRTFTVNIGGEVTSAPTPKCPICQSTNIHKISGANKVGSALMFGVFAAGHVSKTYKCDNCGSKF